MAAAVGGAAVFVALLVWLFGALARQLLNVHGIKESAAQLIKTGGLAAVRDHGFPVSRDAERFYCGALRVQEQQPCVERREIVGAIEDDIDIAGQRLQFVRPDSFL